MIITKSISIKVLQSVYLFGLYAYIMIRSKSMTIWTSISPKFY